MLNRCSVSMEHENKKLQKGHMDDFSVYLSIAY